MLTFLLRCYKNTHTHTSCEEIFFSSFLFSFFLFFILFIYFFFLMNKRVVKKKKKETSWKEKKREKLMKVGTRVDLGKFVGARKTRRCFCFLQNFFSSLLCYCLARKLVRDKENVSVRSSFPLSLYFFLLFPALSRPVRLVSLFFFPSFTLKFT